MHDWRKFLSNYPIKQYEKGQLVVCQDSSPNSCFIIRKGFIKAYVITGEGNEKPITFEGRNDIFPVDVIFGHSEESKYFYEAYTECSVYQIPRDEFLEFIKAHPRVFTRLFHYLIRRTLDYHDHISSLEQAKAVDKLICALNLLVKRFGQQVAKSRALMTLPLTQQDLANFLGLTRETTGTQLKALERNGILQYRRQKYVIRTDRLAVLIAER